MTCRLDQYTTEGFEPGASLLTQLLWFFIGDLLVQTYLIPFSPFKVWILRLFGASIGEGNRIKPGVKIKFPWKLSIGNFCWIGEKAWIDNLVSVTLEDHVCLSQQTYLCTGNHDWNHPQFRLLPGEIYLESGVWIAARAAIGPGVRAKQGAVLCLGAVTSTTLNAMTIYAGNPAIPIKNRLMDQPVYSEMG